MVYTRASYRASLLEDHSGSSSPYDNHGSRESPPSSRSPPSTERPQKRVSKPPVANPVELARPNDVPLDEYDGERISKSNGTFPDDC